MRTWSRQSLTCQPARSDVTAAALSRACRKRLIRCLSPNLESQTRVGCERLIRGLPPSLERQTRARRKAPDQSLATLRLQHQVRLKADSNRSAPIALCQVACVERRSAFPSSGKGPRSVACIELVFAFPGEASDRLAETLTRRLHRRQIRVEGHREMTQQQASGRQHA